MLVDGGLFVSCRELGCDWELISHVYRVLCSYVLKVFAIQHPLQKVVANNIEIETVGCSFEDSKHCNEFQDAIQNWYCTLV